MLQPRTACLLVVLRAPRGWCWPCFLGMQVLDSNLFPSSSMFVLATSRCFFNVFVELCFSLPTLGCHSPHVSPGQPYNRHGGAKCSPLARVAARATVDPERRLSGHLAPVFFLRRPWPDQRLTPPLLNEYISDPRSFLTSSIIPPPLLTLTHLLCPYCLFLAVCLQPVTLHLLLISFPI